MMREKKIIQCNTLNSHTLVDSLLEVVLSTLGSIQGNSKVQSVWFTPSKALAIFKKYGKGSHFLWA